MYSFRDNTIFSIGRKHRGKTFADILATDPGYIDWVLSLNKKHCKGDIKRLQRYAGEKMYPWEYMSKTKLLLHIQSAIASDQLKDILLVQILDAHPRTRGKNIVLNPNDDRGLAIKETDGQILSFSYRNTILPELRGEVNISRQKLLRALRNEVEEHIAEFRIIRGPGYHVDHDFNIAGNQFIELAFKFLQRPSLDLRVELVNIQEEYSRNLLVDRELASQWRQYHRENTQLRQITIRENLSIGGKKRKFYDEL